MTQWKRILTWTVVIGLASWLFVNTVVTLGFTPEVNPLWQTHQELLVVENRMSEIKPLCNELEGLRLQRDQLVEKTDKFINEPIKTQDEVFKPEPTPQETVGNVAEAAEIEVWTEPMKEIKLEFKEPICVKDTAGEDQNEKIRFILEVSGNNKDFLFTLEAENGTFDETRVSGANSNGSRDHGLCQLNSTYHWDYIKSEDFKDWKKQVYYCWDVYQDAQSKGRLETTFYGYNVRYQRAEGKYTCK